MTLHCRPLRSRSSYYREREYAVQELKIFRNPSFPDLVMVESIRNTRGAFLAKTTYRYVPGTQLLVAEERWLLEESRPLTTTFSYDAHGLLTAISDPMDHTTRYAYDVAGNRTVVTDTLGFATHFTYDLLGRLRTQTDALISMTDPLGNVTRVAPFYFRVWVGRLRGQSPSNPLFPQRCDPHRSPADHI
jgi:YD repeat-containing protein